MDWAHFKKTLDWNPQEHRKMGRPKNTLRRGLETEIKKIGKTWREEKRHLKTERYGKTM